MSGPGSAVQSWPRTSRIDHYENDRVEPGKAGNRARAGQRRAASGRAMPRQDKNEQHMVGQDRTDPGKPSIVVQGRATSGRAVGT